jgi:predicted MFS family arabinose efflux permease
MTQVSAISKITQTVDRSRYLSRNAAFYLLASITVSFLAGSSAPTPLYALYQAQWGFSPTTVTVIFGIYALAVLLALLFTGRLSDHLGRRPVLIAATATQAATMVLFATASGVGDLMLARVIQGLATGAAVGAVGAGMIDLNKERGATANAVAPAFGTATGGILSGYLVQYLPAPTHLVYAVLGVIFVLQGIGIVLMADTIAPAPGALASLKPQLSLPAAVRGPLLLALPVLVASWALAGFYASLGPMLVRGMLGVGSALLGGLALFVLAASAGLAVLVLQHREPRAMMTLGASLLAAGVGVAVWSLPHHAIVLFFAGTAIAGMGFGAGFQGAVRSIVPFAAPHERAGVLSIVFIVSYLSMGVPAIAAGALIARHGNILGTGEEFGVVIMMLAVAAVIGAGLGGRQRRAARAVIRAHAIGADRHSRRYEESRNDRSK